MGSKIFRLQSAAELRPEQIAVLMKNTKYTEEEILEIYAEFRRHFPNDKLKSKNFVEAYMQICQHGLAENLSRLEADNGQMVLRLGDGFPNFHLKTTIGDIHLHDWIGNHWCIIFSHPADFTPVCTTELSRAAKLANEFARRHVKCIALSCDSVENHHEWIKDLQAYGSMNDADGDICPPGEFPFPIIEDTNRILAKQLGMIDPEEFDSNGLPLTARVVFVIGPDKKLKASILYPASAGRNFDEILRLIDSLQLSARLPVATPVDWKVGQKVMVPSNVRDEDIRKHLPQGVETQGGLPSGKLYIRMIEV